LERGGGPSPVARTLELSGGPREPPVDPLEKGGGPSPGPILESGSKPHPSRGPPHPRVMIFIKDHKAPGLRALS
jgi:hypothetical protein